MEPQGRVIQCSKCGARNRLGAYAIDLQPVCGRCHTPLAICEDQQPLPTMPPTLHLRSPSAPFWMAWTGVALLFVATASVVVRVPVLGGSEGYIYPGLGAQGFKLALAIAALALTVTKKYRLLYCVGSASALAAPGFYLYATTRLSAMRATLEAEILVSNPPPEGLRESLARHPVQFLLGGTLLIVAGLLLTLAAKVSSKQ